jgi:hypothetical protein
MAKKVSSLTDRLMNVDEQAETPPRIIETDGPRARKPEGQKARTESLVGLNFKVPASFRRDFRRFCAEKDLSLVDALAAAFDALKEREKL